MTKGGTDKRHKGGAFRFLALVAAFLFSTLGTASVLLIRGFSPLSAGFSALLSCILFVIFLFALNGDRFSEKLERKGSERGENFVKFLDDETNVKGDLTIPFLAGAVAASSSGLLPEFIMPFGALALMVSLVRGFRTGMASLLFFAGVSTLSCAEGGLYFFELFLSGFCMILFFRRQTRYGSTLFPLLCYLFLSAGSYLSLLYIFHLEIGPGTFIYPGVGLLLDVIILLVFLPKIREEVLFRDQIFYESINDPEYELLQRLKNEDNEEFQRAIHTAYLSDRVSDSIGADRNLAKILAYYHRIGALRGKRNHLKEKTLSILREDGFPANVMRGIEEYWGLPGTHLGREAAVVKITDSLFDLIMEEDALDEAVNLNYDELVDRIVRKLTAERIYLLSEITLRDVPLIRKRLKQEQLYYKFLQK
ncbi:MAG: hypothetical protein K5989_00980 [Lachnospiraceae bacterium]|nr:hypothetical protein [Lachnospiraceae bacterium]